MKKTILLGFTILCLCCVLLSVSISLPVEIHAYGEDSQLHNSSNDEITATNNNESDDEKTDIGIQIDEIGIENFTDVKYIENADYFKVNPSHTKNDSLENPKGTCTTVAMQLLMGYHNYYTVLKLSKLLARLDIQNSCLNSY